MDIIWIWSLTISLDELNHSYKLDFKIRTLEPFIIYYFFIHSNETREETICRLHMVGLSPSHIRDLTHIRYQKVIKTNEYFKTNGSIPPATKRGRPTIGSNDILSRIMCLAILTNYFSSINMALQKLLVISNKEIQYPNVISGNILVIQWKGDYLSI